MKKRVLAVLTTVACAAAPVAEATPQDTEPQVSRTFVINEVSTEGPNGELDEFLEIRNISRVHQTLTGASVTVFDSTCRASRMFALESLELGAGERLLLVGVEFSGTATAEQVIPADLRLDSRIGGAALSTGSRRIDAVAWEPPLTVGCDLEGDPARTPPPGEGYSITRDVLGTDTDNNRCDFHIDFRSP